MATITVDKQYRCTDDCVHSGCPSHKAKLKFYSITCDYEYHDGKGHVYYFDLTELQNLVDMIKEIDVVYGVKV